MKTTLKSMIKTVGELKAGDWIFEHDGYGFKVNSAVDKGNKVDLYLESDGLVHLTVTTLKKSAKVYSKSFQEGK